MRPRFMAYRISYTPKIEISSTIAILVIVMHRSPSKKNAEAGQVMTVSRSPSGRHYSCSWLRPRCFPFA